MFRKNFDFRSLRSTFSIPPILPPLINGLRLSWYVGEKYLRDLRAKEEFPVRVLESTEAIASFLVSEARKIERGSDAARRESKEQVPAERVKDPSALARELRWRVRLARGYDSDGEDLDLKRGTFPGEGLGDYSAQRRKRKAGDWIQREPRFKNFQPKTWDCVEETLAGDTRRTGQVLRPVDETDSWKKYWLDWNAGGKNSEEGDGVEVSRKTIVSTKIRRTADGLERLHVESNFEQWSWKPSEVDSSGGLGSDG